MKLEDALWQDPERMSGAVCFRDTRIPVSIFFDYLETCDLESFFQGYPDVSREMANAVLISSRDLIESSFVKRKTA